MLIVIPFRSGGKSRLPVEIRAEIALAMFGDVLEAAGDVGDVRVVTSDPMGRLVAEELGAQVLGDPGDGQGPAVVAALGGVEGPCVVVNADLPRARPSDIAALASPARRGVVALVEARDGTTNALGLPSADVFRPLYGRGSAARFRAHAEILRLPLEDLSLANLVDDVDTLADLERVGQRAGSRTRALFEAIRA